MPVLDLPKPACVTAARQVLADHVRLTPVRRSRSLDELSGARLYFKCENLQRTGSFKFRGASYALTRLPAGTTGVATHSSGNHGAALACAAHRAGLAAHIVIPRNATGVKIAAVRAYGGQVHLCEPTQTTREAGLAALVAQGLAPVPPYDDARIIAGQGSVALELMEQVPELDLILAPVGGGGLLAGTALAAAHGGPVVMGAEPAGADDTIRSLAAGSRVKQHAPATLADGLRALVGRRNFALLRQQGVSVLPVPEAAIIQAMTLLWERLKLVVEPSGAVALGAVLTHPQTFAGRRTGIIVSGGNIDVAPLLKTLT